MIISFNRKVIFKKEITLNVPKSIPSNEWKLTIKRRIMLLILGYCFKHLGVKNVEAQFPLINFGVEINSGRL